MANLTNEKCKFAIAIFRLFSPFLKSDISDIKEINICNNYTVYILMPVVTLLSFKMIGRLDSGSG